MLKGFVPRLLVMQRPTEHGTEALAERTGEGLLILCEAELAAGGVRIL